MPSFIDFFANDQNMCIAMGLLSTPGYFLCKEKLINFAQTQLVAPRAKIIFAHYSLLQILLNSQLDFRMSSYAGIGN